MRTADGNATDAARGAQGASPWQDALNQLREWDPEWAETIVKMTTNPWTTGVLPRKTVELVSVALNAGSGSLHPEGARRHIRAALAAGATRDELLTVFKMASMMSVYSSSVGGSILVEELPPSGIEGHREKHPTPTSDRLRAAGRWDPAWDTFFYLDPVWTDELIASGIGIAADGAMAPKLVELLAIAFHASRAHLHAAGIRRHMKAALRLGVKPQEIIEVLKLCVVQGVQASNLLVPILAEELTERAGGAEPGNAQG
jgi:alkylhydroperoxidase/carboxymuconolactone decarboxylase family protein YurZ